MPWEGARLVARACWEAGPSMGHGHRAHECWGRRPAREQGTHSLSQAGRTDGRSVSGPLRRPRDWWRRWLVRLFPHQAGVQVFGTSSMPVDVVENLDRPRCKRNPDQRCSLHPGWHPPDAPSELVYPASGPQPGSTLPQTMAIHTHK